MRTQAEIDKDRRKMAEEIVRAQNLTTLEDAKGFATKWIMTAAQHAANEEYYRNARNQTIGGLNVLLLQAADRLEDSMNVIASEIDPDEEDIESEKDFIAKLRAAAKERP